MRHGFLGRGPAEWSQRGDRERWTPPWLQDDGHRGRHMRREFFGRGRHFGPGGPSGFEGDGRNFFGRGDFKFAVLRLLQERPMHGYEIMKTLEEKSGGFYAPSAGSIYPTLQMLEDRSLVTVAEADGKKVYSITDAGRQFLAEYEKDTETFAGPPWVRGRRGASPEIMALKSEAMEVARLFAIAGRSAIQDQGRLGRLREILADVRKELSDIIYGAKANTGDSPKQ